MTPNIQCPLRMFSPMSTYSSWLPFLGIKIWPIICPRESCLRIGLPKIGEGLKSRRGHFSLMTPTCSNMAPTKSFAVAYTTMKSKVSSRFFTMWLVVDTFRRERPRQRSLNVDFISQPFSNMLMHIAKLVTIVNF